MLEAESQKSIPTFHSKLACTQGHQDLDVGWMQTVDEAHLLVPTKPDVHKKDISFQVHPNRLTLKVKGESLLSGALPEAVNIDGMTLGTRAGAMPLLRRHLYIALLCLCRFLLGT